MYIYLYIYYYVKPHSYPWFPDLWAAPIVYRNHIYCLFYQSKHSEPKVKFRQASNSCNRVLKVAKVALHIL